jgi:hypothetical protein
MPTLYKHPFLRKYIVIVGPFQSNIAYHHPSLKLIKLASRISFQSTIFYQKKLDYQKCTARPLSREDDEEINPNGMDHQRRATVIELVGRDGATRDYYERRAGAGPEGR